MPLTLRKSVRIKHLLEPQHVLRPLRENLERVLGTGFNHLEDLLFTYVTDFVGKQITHTHHKHHARRVPTVGLVPFTVRPIPYIPNPLAFPDHIPISLYAHPRQPPGQRQRVTVLAALTDLLAAYNRIPRRIRPRYSVFHHVNNPHKLKSQNAAKMTTCAHSRFPAL